MRAPVPRARTMAGQLGLPGCFRQAPTMVVRDRRCLLPACGCDAQPCAIRIVRWLPDRLFGRLVRLDRRVLPGPALGDADHGRAQYSLADRITRLDDLDH